MACRARMLMLVVVGMRSGEWSSLVHRILLSSSEALLATSPRSRRSQR